MNTITLYVGDKIDEFFLGKEIIVLDDTDFLDGGSRKLEGYVCNMSKNDKTISINYEGLAIIRGNTLSIITDFSFDIMK